LKFARDRRRYLQWVFGDGLVQPKTKTKATRQNKDTGLCDVEKSLSVITGRTKEIGQNNPVTQNPKLPQIPKK